MGKVGAQTVPSPILAEVNTAIAFNKKLRYRAQPDSAQAIILPAQKKLDSLGYKDTPHFRRLQLERSINYAKSQRFMLALQAMNTVAKTSCAKGEWSTCAAAELELCALDIRIGESQRSQEHLQRAERLINREELEELQGQRLYQRANWQANFGYRDSVRFFLDSLLSLPDVAPQVKASAYRMHGGNTMDDIVLQDSFFSAASALYRQLGDYQALSATTSALGGFYLYHGNIEEGLSLNQRAMEYTQEAELKNQDVALVKALIYQQISKYYKKENKLDSSLIYAEKGLSQEMIYWRNSAYHKAAEARQLYRNEEQERQLAAREQELKIERLRSYGLLGFTVLIVLLSLWTIRLYRQLKNTNQLVEAQAADLEASNEDLVAANNRVEESLQLQKMLKAELQHRVKNNMQLILGIFNRGRDNVDNPEVQRMLKAQQEQIRSIVLLHQKIDLKSNEREIDPAAYLGEIVTNLERSYSGVFPNVRIHLDLNVDLIHIDSAIPLGLILNELVTNAYKYAFPGGGPGNIHVGFAKLPGHFYLRVEDDGIGLPNDVKARRNDSMGTRLIRGLIRQLEGTIEWIDRQPGTIVQVKYGAYSQVIV